MMKSQYKYYGWQASYFAGKIRGYLNYKGVDYVEKNINMIDMLVTLPKHTGRQAMPALETKQGEWFCDTPLIMAELEKRHPQPPVLVEGPVQNFVSELFQNWVDDAWIPVALHSRWSYPENYEKLNREEAGKSLLPFAPRFIRNRVADKAFLQNMARHLPATGVVPEQLALLESWTKNSLDLLEIHFSKHGYLLGERPTVADFGLLGPMFGHLNRDPWPKRQWLDLRPNLQKWVEKMARGDKTSGELLEHDNIPETLMPLIKIILTEYMPFMDKTVQDLKGIIAAKQLKSGDKLPRSTGRVELAMMDARYKRASFSYSLWRMQRTQKMVAKYSQVDKDCLNTWLSKLGQADFLSVDFGCELKRHGLVASLA
jgi:glutathione S-transferase